MINALASFIFLVGMFRTGGTSYELILLSIFIVLLDIKSRLGRDK